MPYFLPNLMEEPVELYLAVKKKKKPTKPKREKGNRPGREKKKPKKKKTNADKPRLV